MRYTNGKQPRLDTGNEIKADELIQPEEIAEIVRFILTRKGKGTIDEFYIRRFSGLAFD